MVHRSKCICGYRPHIRKMNTVINIYISTENYSIWFSIFFCLRRNFVERNAVITLYRDFLSSPTNCPGYCWSNSCDGWFGKGWLGSDPIKWWTSDKRVGRYLMKRITANQYQTSERYYKIPKILFEDERGTWNWKSRWLMRFLKTAKSCLLVLVGRTIPIISIGLMISLEIRVSRPAISNRLGG